MLVREACRIERRFKVVRSALAALVLASIAFCVPAQATTRPQNVQIAIFAHGCVLHDLRLNDFPVGDIVESSIVLDANDKLIHGENVLSFKAVRLPTAGNADVRVTGTLVSVPSDATLETLRARPHQALNGWRPDALQPRLPGKITFDYTGATPIWAWQKGATVMTVSAGDKRAIIGVVRSIATALSHHDLSALHERLATDNADVVRAFGGTVAELQTSTDRLYQESLYAPHLVLLPIEPATIAFAQFAHKRVVEPVRSNGDAVLRTARDKDGGTFSVPLYLSKINGTWTVVR